MLDLCSYDSEYYMRISAIEQYGFCLPVVLRRNLREGKNMVLHLSACSFVCGRRIDVLKYFRSIEAHIVAKSLCVNRILLSGRRQKSILCNTIQ